MLNCRITQYKSWDIKSASTFLENLPNAKENLPFIQITVCITVTRQKLARVKKKKINDPSEHYPGVLYLYLITP
jgi:hypothetical protein